MSGIKDSGRNPFAELDLSGIGPPNSTQTADIAAPYGGRSPSPNPGASTPATRTSRPTRNSAEKNRASQTRSKSQKRKKSETSEKNMKKTRADPAQRQDQDVDMQHEGSGLEERGKEDPFARMQAFIENQFKNTNEKIMKMNASMSKVSDRVDINKRNLDRLKYTVESNSDSTDLEIQRLHAIIEEKDRERGREIETIRTHLTSLDGDSVVVAAKESVREIQQEISRIKETSTALRSGSGKQSLDFGNSRRSVRLWPVVPENGESMASAAGRFIHELMRVPRSSLTDQDVEEVTRVTPRAPRARKQHDGRTGGKDGVHDEINVRCKSAPIRDLIMSHAVNLATAIDAEGKPTAGVRIDVPQHLNGQFQDFLAYGRALHKTHGRGFKRHVKFDDQDECLYMNIKLPNTEEWLYVDHAMAMESRKMRLQRNTAITRERLTSSQSSQSSRGDDVEAATQAKTSQATSKTLEKVGPDPGRDLNVWE